MPTRTRDDVDLAIALGSELLGNGGRVAAVAVEQQDERALVYALERSHLQGSHLTKSGREGTAKQCPDIRDKRQER